MGPGMEGGDVFRQVAWSPHASDVKVGRAQHPGRLREERLGRCTGPDSGPRFIFFLSD